MIASDQESQSAYRLVVDYDRIKSFYLRKLVRASTNTLNSSRSSTESTRAFSFVDHLDAPLCSWSCSYMIGRLFQFCRSIIPTAHNMSRGISEHLTLPKGTGFGIKNGELDKGAFRRVIPVLAARVAPAKAGVLLKSQAMRGCVVFHVLQTAYRTVSQYSHRRAKSQKRCIRARKPTPRVAQVLRPRFYIILFATPRHPTDCCAS